MAAAVGTSLSHPPAVIPAHAGTHGSMPATGTHVPVHHGWIGQALASEPPEHWIPACAGMTPVNGLPYVPTTTSVLQHHPARHTYLPLTLAQPAPIPKSRKSYPPPFGPGAYSPHRVAIRAHSRRTGGEAGSGGAEVVPHQDRIDEDAAGG